MSVLRRPFRSDEQRTTDNGQLLHQLRVGGHRAAGVIARKQEMAIRNLSNLHAPKKANENKKRVGRGMGS
ncbi:MAG: hypothetical protein ABSE27_11995, partial [Acidobacteriaceae bacterium]